MKNRSLILAAVEDVPPECGGAMGRRYAFMLGNKLSMLTIEAFQNLGSA